MSSLALRRAVSFRKKKKKTDGKVFGADLLLVIAHSRLYAQITKDSNRDRIERSRERRSRRTAITTRRHAITQLA